MGVFRLGVHKRTSVETPEISQGIEIFEEILVYLCYVFNSLFFYNDSMAPNWRISTINC